MKKKPLNRWSEASIKSTHLDDRLLNISKNIKSDVCVIERENCSNRSSTNVNGSAAIQLQFLFRIKTKCQMKWWWWWNVVSNKWDERVRYPSGNVSIGYKTWLFSQSWNFFSLPFSGRRRKKEARERERKSSLK